MISIALINMYKTILNNTTTTIGDISMGPLNPAFISRFRTGFKKISVNSKINPMNLLEYGLISGIHDNITLNNISKLKQL